MINKDKNTQLLFAEEQLLKEYSSNAERKATPEDVPGPADQNIVAGRETILLIDDEQVIVDVAGEMLKILGYQVLVAQSGREAIDIYARRKDEIDLVIQDMMLPGMDGTDIFQALKKINPEVKVILSSGYVMDEQIAAIMEQGCRALMPKPFRLEDLSVKVRNVLDFP